MSTDSPAPSKSSRGRAQFIERLVEEQRAPLVRYAARMLGDPDRARDVVQDAFAKLLAQPEGAVDGHAVEWLFTVCRNRVFDLLRKERRMKLWEEGEAECLQANEPPPGRRLEEMEERARVLDLVGRLPQRQQEVLRLKFQNGFSYKEIARITGLSVSNVGFLIHAAVSRLRTDGAAETIGGGG